MSQTQVALDDDRPNAPRSAYSLLPARPTTAIVASLIGIAALGWAYTVREAESMPGMVMGLGEVGRGMNMGMATTAFLAMWAAMMVAMMAPTVAPMALAYRASLPKRRSSVMATALFVFGFLLVWAATGVVALAPYRLILELPASAADSRWLPRSACFSSLRGRSGASGNAADPPDPSATRMLAVRSHRRCAPV